MKFIECSTTREENIMRAFLRPHRKRFDVSEPEMIVMLW